MLEIYYTGATKFLANQLDPNQSIGGLISNSIAPNDFLNNLFTNVVNNGVETKAIVIKNITGATITAFTAYFDSPTDESGTPLNLGSYEIGWQVPTADDCSNLSVEKLVNSASSPHAITLVSADGSQNPISFPDIDDDQYLGIFIKRTVVQSPKTNDELIDIFNEITEVLTLETVKVVFSWT